MATFGIEGIRPFFEVWHFRRDGNIVKIESLDDLIKLDLYIMYMNDLQNK